MLLVLLVSGTEAQNCDAVRVLVEQGSSIAEAAAAIGVSPGAARNCFAQRSLPRTGIAPHGAAGPAPHGAAGPAPHGAAGPAPQGAAGPAPHGAPGPAPQGAAGPATY